MRLIPIPFRFQARKLQAHKRLATCKTSAAPKSLALFIVLASLVACGGGSETAVSNGGLANNETATNNEATPQAAEAVQVSVKSFDSTDPCAELHAYLVDYAEQQMRRQLTASRDALSENNSFEGPMPLPAAFTTGGVNAPASAPAATSAGDSAARTGASNFTMTNVQSAGIDELDMAKNNAANLFRLHNEGNVTFLSKARYWPANELTMAGKVAVPTHAQSPQGSDRAWVSGMFITETERAVVLSSVNTGYYFAGGDPSNASGVTASAVIEPAVSASSLPICFAAPCGGPQIQRSYLDLFDASGQGAPVLQGTIEIGGSLLGARRRGDRVWLLTQQAFKIPAGVLYWPQDYNYSGSLAERRAAFDRLIEQNAVKLRSASTTDWLPEDLARAVSSNSSAAAQACRTVKKVSEPTELAWLRVASVNLADRSVVSELVLADGQTVYASEKAIYVSTPNWRNFTAIDPGPRTYLHKFAINGQGFAQYAASGAFAGNPLNSYSFDEDAQGTLRFAANAIRKIESGAWEPYSYLGLIQQQGDRLVVASRSAPIAPGERMQSARYIGDRGYLVTFRIVDPFFVFDMNAAGGPKQLGELKIPGFSTYLHPIGTRHLVGIGYSDGGWPRRIKASLFDVTDPANPKEQSAVVLADIYSGSDALWDPHAFNFLAQSAGSGVMAVPVWSYAYGPTITQQSSLKLINVSTTLGLSVAGSISVDDVLASPNAGVYPQDRYVRRSILADGYAFAVGERMLRSASLSQPDTPVATLLTP